MKTEAEIIAEHESRAFLPAIALSLWREKSKPKEVFNSDQLANLVERHFELRPSTKATIFAMRHGAKHRAWRLLGEGHASPHIELTADGLRTYVEAWRYVSDGELYAVETIGVPHLQQSVDAARSKAEESYKFNQTMGYESKGDLGFDDLREHVDFMFGLNEFRLRGRSSFSRKVDAEINWSKWSAVAGIAAVPLAILLWWLS